MDSTYSMTTKLAQVAAHGQTKEQPNVRADFFYERISVFSEYVILAFVILATLLGYYLSFSSLMSGLDVF